MKNIFSALMLSIIAVPTASAQFIFVPPQPVAPIVSYSFYQPTPVFVAPQPVMPVTSFYQPVTPTTVFYGPAPVAVAPVAVAPVAPVGVVTTQTNTWGLGIFRPRVVTTQSYFTPFVR